MVEIRGGALTLICMRIKLNRQHTFYYSNWQRSVWEGHVFFNKLACVLAFVWVPITEAIGSDGWTGIRYDISALNWDTRVRLYSISWYVRNCCSVIQFWCARRYILAFRRCSASAICALVRVFKTKRFGYLVLICAHCSKFIPYYQSKWSGGAVYKLVNVQNPNSASRPFI